MSSIGDSQNTVQAILASNGGQTRRGFFGVCALGLGDDLILRDTMSQKVVMADAPFGISRTAAATQRNNQRSEAFAIEGESMIEPGTQHRRGTAVVFRRAKDSDSVGSPCFIVGGVEVDPPVEPNKPTQNGDQAHNQQQAKHPSAG